MKKIASALGISYLLPLVAFAQFDDTELKGYVTDIINFLNDVILPAILAIAFLVFIWGVFTYFIRGAAEEEKRQSGRDLMLWGIIGFVVIIIIVGLVNLFANATGLQDKTLDNFPNLPIP